MLRCLAKLTIVILLIVKSGCASTQKIPPLGSILFEDHGFSKSCFMQNDIAALATKLKFHQLLPNDVETMSDDGVMALVKYFHDINEIIEHMNPSEQRQLLQKCFYDTLGGYMKHLILPITRYSFYAGNVSLTTVQRMENLYERCKELLNTNGNSWSDPITDFSGFSNRILPISIRSTNENEAMKSCASLVLNSEEDMMVSLPKIETDDDDDDLSTDELSTILWLPFKHDQSIFNVNSKRSAFVLLRYFVMTSQCFAYQGIDQSVFNRQLKMWINENVLQFLDDDEVYPAFGAVLRIFETVKDSHDSTYRGTQERKIKRQRQLLSSPHSKIFGDEGEEFSFEDPNRDIYWWLNAALASIGILILTCLIVYLFVRICCNQGKIRRAESGGGKRSLKEKISSVLQKSTHLPEQDEYYQYKKLPKSIKFENERPRRKFLSKLRGSKREKISLPRLNHHSGTETEEEIVLHESKTPSMSSLSVGRKKGAFEENDKLRKKHQQRLEAERTPLKK